MPNFERMLLIVEQDRTEPSVRKELIQFIQAHGSEITLLGHCEPPDMSLLNSILGLADVTAMATIRGSILARLEQFAAPLRDAGIKVHLSVLEGDLVDGICEKAKTEQFDLVAKLAEGASPDLPYTFGSTDRSLFRRCPIPVLVFKAHDEVRRKTLIAVDVGRPQMATLNQRLLKIGADEARTFSAEVHVVNVWRLKGESAMRSGAFTEVDADKIDEFRSQEREHRKKGLKALVESVDLSGVNVVEHLVEGPPEAGVLAVAKSIDADLLILGTRQNKGFLGSFLGNSAEAVLAAAECSVLLVRAPAE